MKKVVVLQPQFLPWVGFFEQIILSDVFVFYDDVQFPQGRSFTNRVQIKTRNGSIKWLTVPTKHEGKKNINETLLDNTQNWKEKHLNLIRENYKNAKYFKNLMKLLEEIYSIPSNNLSELNTKAIIIICDYLDIKSEFIKSSELSIKGKSTERLVDIVAHLNGSHYITGHGALNYLNFESFEQQGITVEVMKYNCRQYHQMAGEFTPYVSIIDGIANEGKGIVDIMDSKAVYWKENTI